MINRALTFDDVLLVPRYNQFESRNDVDTTARMGPFTFRTPFISSNMDTVTGASMATAMAAAGGLGILHRFWSIEDNVSAWCAASKLSRGEDMYEVGVSVGVKDTEFERAAALYEAGARILCVDIAHAHTQRAGRMVSHIREVFSDAFVIAGNVATADGADYLVEKGAHAIKVGLGPGSACTTRIKTGVGIPQLYAIRECSRVNATIIADGGIRHPGDAVKALAAGADFVMLGGFFAGAEETPGDLIVKDKGWQISDGINSPITVREPEYVKVFRGMASKEAQDDFMGSMEGWKTAEGESFKVPYKGPVADLMRDLVGGLRSGMTYCGSATLADLQKRAKFVEITSNGRIESRAHGRPQD